MRLFINGLIAGGLIVAGQVMAAPADEIKALLEQNKFVEAYQAGRAQPDQLGDPAFDFYFGIAAIDAGHSGEGVLSLERYLLNFPDNRSARFQLARGYFVLGEDLRARDEFELLLSQAEGAEKQAIERFLEALRSRESRYKPSASAYLEAGIGFDGNLNAGLNSGSTPNIPGLGNLPALAGQSVSARERDSFTSLAGGAQGVYPVAPGIALTGSVGFDARMHNEHQNDVFDQLNFGASVGASFLRGNSIYKLGLGAGQLAVDNQRYVFTTSVSAEWAYQLDQFNRFDLSGQAAHLSYDDMMVYPLKNKSTPRQSSDNSVRTADFYGLTGGWTHVFGGEFKPVLKLSANYGEEHNQEDRPDLSRDIFGLRATGFFSPAPRWGASLGLGYQEAHHQDTFAFPGATASRRDATWSLEAGISYQYDSNLSVRAEYSYTDQRSNIQLYEYNRDLLTFKVRYDFK